ncbi:hypothetical protein [Luteimonas saliphila]|uniref:hypothetical protein n=1 Tax=Luteimonas saliphila TaxID=2804919 RepID=UPI00192DBFCB|nr:hypothetical protein [Luteimonas saliphila]
MRSPSGHDPRRRRPVVHTPVASMRVAFVDAHGGLAVATDAGNARRRTTATTPARAPATAQ